MITVISGTNRPEANSLLIAKQYISLLQQRGADCQLLDLATLPTDFIVSEMYGNRTPAFDAFIGQFIGEAERFVFIVPEYNGGFPGVLKTFIDSFSPSAWRNKKAALVGVSSGRAGNIVGMTHLVDVLNYVGVSVLARKPKLSGIEALLDGRTAIDQPEVLHLMEQQIDLFLEF